ncbi:MAG: hypothetical protein IPN33_04300 [Saprospiraceae bacterium]|nr:hypothetical protein [Saprospiraceae bacterium]
MTTEIFNWILTLLAGVLLGGFFFGGLWYTIQKGLTAKYPAVWFLGSMLVRTGVVLTGFYFTSGGKWERMVAALIGFIIARFVVMRLKEKLIKSTL